MLGEENVDLSNSEEEVTSTNQKQDPYQHRSLNQNVRLK